MFSAAAAVHVPPEHRIQKHGLAARCNGRAVPTRIELIGRPHPMENADICGEYFASGSHNGRALYCKVDSGTNIYYEPNLKKWVLNRHGMKGQSYAAYTDEFDETALHPGRAELQWWVYSGTQAFIMDSQIVAVSAPKEIALFGRAPGTTNYNLMGCYELAGVHHGRPFYKHRDHEYVIKFCLQANKWVIGQPGTDNANAFAVAIADATHPGNTLLEWTFYDPLHGWNIDRQVRAFVAPERVHILKTGEAVCPFSGTYLLGGHLEDRPVYLNHDINMVLRYSERHDAWLVCAAGHNVGTKKRFFDRVASWLFSSREPSSDHSVAYAKANGASDPSKAKLEWHVWSSVAGRFAREPALFSTSAPMLLELAYKRSGGLQEKALCGIYELNGYFEGRVLYQQRRGICTLYWRKETKQWTISPSHPSEGRGCCAYASALFELELPMGARPWWVFDHQRGQYAEDSCGLSLTQVASAATKGMEDHRPAKIRKLETDPSAPSLSRVTAMAGA